MTQDSPLHVIILMPLRDDWFSAAELIRRINRIVSPNDFRIEVLLIDDASLQRCPEKDFQDRFAVVSTIRVLRLRRNLGHQRALAVGISYIQAAATCDAVLVMDSDGEDTHDGVLDLLRAYKDSGGKKAIFAGRSRRSESFLFRSFYNVYRALHYAFTGVGVRVGNFSILPVEYLNSLVAMSELWNHYAASVFRSRLPYTMVPIPRGKRIAGRSKMSFAALVSHGLSAISVFGDIVGVRLLIGSLLGCILTVCGILLTVALHILKGQHIPAWVICTEAVCAVVTIQFFTIAASFTFTLLSNRSNLGIVPCRDYPLFVEGVVEIPMLRG